jgi:hypothetical protein
LCGGMGYWSFSWLAQPLLNSFNSSFKRSVPPFERHKFGKSWTLQWLFYYFFNFFFHLQIYYWIFFYHWGMTIFFFIMFPLFFLQYYFVTIEVDFFYEPFFF